MKIIFVRHGESTGNAIKMVQGLTNTELTEKGREQAKALAERLKDVKIDVIYTSKLNRALNTAKEIALFHKEAEFIPTDGLRERDYGLWNGTQIKDIPESEWNIRYDPDFRPPGGETIREIYVRLRKFVEAILKEHNNDTVLFVSHAASGRVMKAVLSGKSPEEVKEIEGIDNADEEVFNITRVQ